MASDQAKVAPWPAVPTAKPEEVYAGLSDQAKAYPLFLESILRQEHNFDKPEALSRIRVLDCTHQHDDRPLVLLAAGRTGCRGHPG